MILSACTKNTRISPEQLGFRYHIPIKPHTFDPILQKGTASWFLLNHLYRPLVGINEKDELYFNAAKECFWNQERFYVCKLKPGLRFENSLPITAQHFKNSFELVFEQVTEASGFFLSLENQNPSTDIIAIDEQTLQFSFKKHSPQDVYLLAKTEFAPRPDKKLYKAASEVISSGPYKVLSHQKGQFIVLTTNDINNDLMETRPRPNVSIYFIEDEGSAIRMYEAKGLDFIKNVPRTFFSKYQDQLHFQTMMRMDGIGLSSQALHEDLRKAMAYSLNYTELQTIYQSKGLPGCPAIPKKLYNEDHCYNFDLDKAQEHFQKVPADLKDKLWKLSFSEVGGIDIKKGMEWAAHQWQKNLGLNIRIEPLESGQFFQKIHNKNFDIIRKGIPLLTPTCSEALDGFTTDSVNNFLKISNTKLDQSVTNLKLTSLDQIEKQKALCDQGLKALKQTYSFIPLGEMYFAFLSNGKYKNWSVNSFNMLNLENLQPILTENSP